MVGGGELLDVFLSLLLVLAQLKTLFYSGVVGVDGPHGIIVTLVPVVEPVIVTVTGALVTEVVGGWGVGLGRGSNCGGLGSWTREK